MEKIRLKIKVLSFIIVLTMLFMATPTLAISVDSASDGIDYTNALSVSKSISVAESIFGIEIKDVIVKEAIVESCDEYYIVETSVEYIPTDSNISAANNSPSLFRNDSADSTTTTYLSKSHTMYSGTTLNDVTAIMTAYATFDWDSNAGTVSRYNEYYVAAHYNGYTNIIRNVTEKYYSYNATLLKPFSRSYEVTWTVGTFGGSKSLEIRLYADGTHN